MNRRSLSVLALVAVIVVAVIIVLHVGLTRSLTSLVESVVLAQADGEAQVGETRVAAFRGRVVLRDVVLARPSDLPEVERITIEELRVRLSPFAALRSAFDVRRVDIAGMYVTVVHRETDGAAAG